ncbi:homologous recombination OB-fold protein isoform X2 [Tripterygium wilfordii]|uniref:homologous recombination OB-fold protein isoform X2 n=1 Tax=Tripterygium wilfordii TaxID=458696 RepID=UPI0018F85A47|nr:homologous recombination OB-fold protein isoform X2 [Tripterygium wilfordii]
MEEPSQEALDLDDSDLPSLRRASSAKSTVQSLETTTNSTGLRRCSLLSHSSQSIPSQSPNTLRQFHTQPAPPPFPRVIPGPAGAVQSAMQRKRILEETESLDLSEGEPIPTQEYIRRAVKDGSGYDEDFSRDPWLCTVDFIRRKGMVDSDGVAIGMPLSSIKNGLNMYKVPQVVAIVKSCAPNGLGDMMATLKDPTGTIDASIHRQVLTEGEFRKDITIGAVLILQEVAVFSPSRSTYYLNITLANLVKVISRDSHSPLMQNDAVPTDKHVAHGVEGTHPLLMPQKPFSQSIGVAEQIMNSLRQNTGVKGSACNDEQIEEGIVAPESSSCSKGSGRNINVVVGKGPLQVRRNIVHETESAAGQGTNGSDRSVLEAEQPENVHQRQPLNSRSSLPQWTDEQLDELFVFD